MSESKLILPSNIKKLMPRNEDQLQSQMFAELDRKGLLKVKKLGGTAAVFRDNKKLIQVVYLEESDAVKICDAMNEYFAANNMSTWSAIAMSCELF